MPPSNNSQTRPRSNTVSHNVNDRPYFFTMDHFEADELMDMSGGIKADLETKVIPVLVTKRAIGKYFDRNAVPQLPLFDFEVNPSIKTVLDRLSGLHIPEAKEKCSVKTVLTHLPGLHVPLDNSLSEAQFWQDILPTLPHGMKPKPVAIKMTKDEKPTQLPQTKYEGFTKNLKRKIDPDEDSSNHFGLDEADMLPLRVKELRLEGRRLSKLRNSFGPE